MVFSVFAETSYSQVPDSPTNTPHPNLSPSLISLMVSVDVKHHERRGRRVLKLSAELRQYFTETVPCAS